MHPMKRTASLDGLPPAKKQETVQQLDEITLEPTEEVDLDFTLFVRPPITEYDIIVSNGVVC